MSIRKIVILGPESTGKSTLCEQLAQHYNTLWCQEYAREYLLKHGMNYSYDDLLTIAKGQVESEEKSSQLIANSSQLLFIDTDMYVTKLWCEFVFEKCHSWILNQIVERKYDLYLLCNTDLPWVKDELREYPDLPTRNKLFYIYKDILVNQSTPWAEISGNNEERLQRALAIVDGMFAG
jgi:NadR type nicotinamide-nucleotide adenylyltransferase